MPAGSKPGERRGGRKTGTPNRRTIGEAYFKEQAKNKPTQEQFDSLAAKRQVCGALLALASEEQRKKRMGEKFDPKYLLDTLEAADHALNGLLPYEHRRLAILEPSMETVVKPDGSVHITITQTESEL